MQTKYGRRLVTIPGMLLTAIALAITAPILVPVLAVADLMTGWRRRRLLRLWAMASSYVWFELVGITVSGVLWTLSGFGLLMHVRAIRRAHHRLHWWWTGSLVRAMQRFLALELEIDGDLPHGRPLVVISRHCSFGDALLPSALLGEHHRYELRHVLKRELVWDPCLDLVGNRLENHFVDRAPDDNSSELEAIRSLAIGIRGAQAAVIFPEGTFSREAGLKPFRMGAFVAAARAGMPVLVSGLRGSRAILRDQTWLPRRGQLTLTVGPLLVPGGNDWSAAVALRDAARQAMLDLCGEHDLER